MRVTCPDVGALRAALDNAASTHSQTALSHAQTCPSCNDRLVQIGSNARFARDAFARLGPVEASAVPSAEPIVQLEERPQPRARLERLRHGVRWAAAAAAAIAVMAFAVVTPHGQAATAQFLAQFRGQRLAVVSIDPSQARLQLPELSNFAIVKGDARRRPETVSSVADASARAGFQVKAPAASTLPASVQNTPRTSVVRGQDLRFSFDAARAAEYFKSINRADLRLPDRINGTTLIVEVPAVVMLEYASTSSNGLGLIVAQAGELSASTEGTASLEEIREYLLGMPSLSESTVKQLRAIGDWRTTLPIPVPTDQIQWQTTTVNGAPGYLFVNKGVPGSALLWNVSGRTYGVLGDVSQPELQRVADALR
jgi:hypothetical protein